MGEPAVYLYLHTTGSTGLVQRKESAVQHHCSFANLLGVVHLTVQCPSFFPLAWLVAD